MQPSHRVFVQNQSWVLSMWCTCSKYQLAFGREWFLQLSNPFRHLIHEATYYCTSLLMILSLMLMQQFVRRRMSPTFNQPRCNHHLYTGRWFPTHWTSWTADVLYVLQVLQQSIYSLIHRGNYLDTPDFQSVQKQFVVLIRRTLRMRTMNTSHKTKRHISVRNAHNRINLSTQTAGCFHCVASSSLTGNLVVTCKTLNARLKLTFTAT